MSSTRLLHPTAIIAGILALTVALPSLADRGRVFEAGIVPTPPGGMNVTDFTAGTASPTPGNVGVCLSGGGSRALSTGMGQLRALKYLTANGLTLLEQAKALSTISGGAWVGMPFSYLDDPGVSDDDYLNLYVADPGRLVPTATPGHFLAETLDALPTGNIGAQVNEAFSAVDIGLQARWLHQYEGVPAHMLWQTIVGLHLLAPYGLFLPGRELAPTDSFTYDQDTLDELLGMPGQNPDLANLPMHLVADSASRLTRPYPFCSTSMFVEANVSEPQNGQATYQFLAPVQSTPFFTGIVSSPRGLNVNGLPPGGGGVSPFAFNSTLLRVDEELAGIAMPSASSPTLFPHGEHRPFSLTDAVGASSAFYAEVLQNLFTSWENDPSLYIDALRRHGEENLRWASPYLTADTRDAIGKELDRVSSARTGPRSSGHPTGRSDAPGHGATRLQQNPAAMRIKDLVPQYRYWPVANAEPRIFTRRDRFADGGALENTGVNVALSYADIDTLIAFVNSPTELQPNNGTQGQLTVDGDLTIHTNIVVDSQLPPLFGYQPFDKATGTYVLYQGAAAPGYPQGIHSQSFPAEHFPDFLLGLWSASGDGRTACANLLQEMPVLENEWFGIAPRGSISVLWVYTNFTRSWFDKLSPDVQQLFEGRELQDFPHFSTFDTELSPTQVNLLASLTAWCVADEQNRALFTNLFTGRP